jgi:late competence protein required for DNA uptake (superfamily II DNA/RNA helicase)
MPIVTIIRDLVRFPVSSETNLSTFLLNPRVKETVLAETYLENSRPVPHFRFLSNFSEKIVKNRLVERLPASSLPIFFDSSYVKLLR